MCGRDAGHLLGRIESGAERAKLGDPLSSSLGSEVLAPVVADDRDREVLTAGLGARLAPVEVATNQVERSGERAVEGKRP